MATAPCLVPTVDAVLGGFGQEPDRRLLSAMMVDIDANGSERTGRSLKRGRREKKQKSSSSEKNLLGDSHSKPKSEKSVKSARSSSRSPSWDKAGYEARRAELREVLTYD